MPHNTRFTQDEIEFIQNNYQVLSVDEIASHLDRSAKGVRNKIERLGLSLRELPRNNHSWSEDEIKYLTDHYTLSDVQLRKKLNRFSLQQIYRKRHELGLTKSSGKPYIHSGYYVYQRDGKNVWVHKEVACQMLGRPLSVEERVHHIDGNKLHNEPSNLFVCADKNQHGSIHASLEQVAFQLVRKGVIQFDSSKGCYYLKE